MNSVQHIALNCTDLTRQEEFYPRHFGFRRAGVYHADTPDEIVMLRLGAIRLELFSATGEAKSQVGGEQPVDSNTLPSRSRILMQLWPIFTPTGSKQSKLSTAPKLSQDFVSASSMIQTRIDSN